MPRIDDGRSDGPPGNELQTAWVELSADEAHELLESLKVWAEDIEEAIPIPDGTPTSRTTRVANSRSASASARPIPVHEAEASPGPVFRSDP